VEQIIDDDGFMKNPTPFDLNEAIRRWQKNLGTSPAFSADNLEEMASHLGASVQKLKATGLSDKDAFETAVRRIGERGPLEREFAKVSPAAPSSFSAILFWIVAGLYLFGVVNLLINEILYWRRMLEVREFVRFMTTGSPDHVIWFARAHYQPSSLLVLEASVVMVIVIVLGARLVARSWRGVGALIRIFDRPIGPALSLIGFGVGLTVLPALPTHFLAKNPSGNYSGEIFLTSVNLAVVLIMVFLSRPALRKT
jgi:hypothetical protein